MTANINKQNFKLFPILVSKYQDFLTYEQRKNISDYCLNQQTKQHQEIYKDGTSNHSLDTNFILDLVQHVPGCSDLGKKLEFCVNDYAKEFGMVKLNITNSWFNVQQPGSILNQHIHPNSVVSGALYVNTDSKSSLIYFENPNKVINYFSHYTTPSDYNFEHCHYQPEAGSLFIFPSWLYHGSKGTENQSTNRIVISFNTVPAK